MKIWKKLFNHSNKISKPNGRNLLLAICLLLFAVLPFRVGKADCGISTSPHYSFVHLDLLAWQSDYAPYLMGYQVINDIYALQQRDPQYDDNIGEWRGRFCDIPDSSDVEDLIYDATIDELTNLRDAASKRKRVESYQLQDNTFAQVLKENGCLETIDYLIFAKTCERYCVKSQDWSEIPKDQAQMFFLINRGRSEFRRTESPFLRLRYAYQILRLAHYAKDPQAVLRIWDDVIPKVERIRSIMNYWALGHKAGALKALGRRAEAAYLFGVVFRYCPSKRKQAFESFDIQNEKEWQDCLAFCKNPQERAALYAMRASQDKAHALDDMFQLYKLDPKNEHLDMLLIRETLRMEKIMLSSDYRTGKLDARTAKSTKEYLGQLIEFVTICANHGIVKNPALWRTTEGYLRLLDGDWQKALATLYEAKKTAGINDLLADQIENYVLLARIVGLHINYAQMDSSVNVIRASRAYASDPDFDPILHEKLAAIFRQSGSMGAAYLCEKSIGDLEKNPNMALIDDLIRLCQKPTKTMIEKELTTEGGKTIEPILWDLKGMYYLSRFQLEASAEAFNQVPPERRVRRYSPFADKIKDCVRCSSSDTAGLVDKYTFVRQMLDLQYKANAALEQAAPYYYKLGLGYYNMTYFGNSSGLADAFRDWRSWQSINQGRNVFSVRGNPLGNMEVLDCSVAKQYFELARQMSWNTDRELSAKAAFWAAKCEQNLFYISAESRYRTGSRLAPDVPPQYRTYFTLLRNYYGNTEFYKQAQTECKYFRFYTS
ncbi:MAG: hypothetical protein JNL70_03315, partial [Saprospiraceae bacterium]|nr:hypothetical protein [Saprospiraceae bacterium]